MTYMATIAPPNSGKLNLNHNINPDQIFGLQPLIEAHATASINGSNRVAKNKTYLETNKPTISVDKTPKNDGGNPQISNFDGSYHFGSEDPLQIVQTTPKLTSGKMSRVESGGDSKQ